MDGKALVLGYDTRSFLSVVRSLGRAGIQVHVAWHQPDNAALRSRYVAAIHDLPPFQLEDGLWKARLIELVDREKYDLIIPCHDSCLAPLQKYRAELEPHGRFYLISDEAFAVFSDKFRTAALARSLGINAPREVLLRRSEDLEAALQEFDYPVVLKPQASFNPRDPEVRREARKVYTRDQLTEAFQLLIQDGPVALQENVLGRGAGVEILMKSGEPLLAFQHVRLHEPPLGGGSSYRMSMPLSPELLDASLRLLKAVNYTGLAMVEFKIDEKTGRWALMEVNARVWGSLPLALAAGVDFPLALFRMAVEGRTRFQNGYRQGICCRNWSADVEWFLANLRADRTDPTLTTLPIGTTIAETFKNVLLFRERSDTFVLDDPAPAWHEVRQLTQRKLSSARRKLSARAMRLRPFRRWAAWQLHRRMRHARRILFVCKGNICRGPLAEAAARERLPSLEIASAGYLPESSRTPPESARAAAAAAGFDLSSHRSQVLSDELVSSADVVLVFDDENYRHVTATYPSARRRTFLLGILCSADTPFIRDPWGRETETYSVCYRQIVEGVSSLAEMIQDTRSTPSAAGNISRPLGR